MSGDVYPATSDISLNRLDEAGELPLEIKAKAQKSYADVTVDPKFKGFAYCDTVPYVADTPATIHDTQGLTVRINGEEISYEALKTRPIGLDYAFERDEYVVIQKRYQMVNAVFGGL